MKVLAIDPGGTTGFAIVEGPFEPPAFFLIHDLKQIKGVQGYLAYLKTVQVDAFVCEDFIKRPNHFSGKWDPSETAKMVGMARGIAYVRGINWFIQQPSQRAAGFKFIGGQPSSSDRQRHQKDALAHGIVWVHERISMVHPSSS